MKQKPNVVWILGSGFSRSLGGPLLYDLLSELGKEDASSRFPNLKLAPVYRVFDSYKKGNRTHQPVYWDHAEQFLTFVDEAASDTHHRHKLLKQILFTFKEANVELAPQAFRDNCAQGIAAECMFTLGVRPLSHEAWQPYLHWAAARGDTDTIITFNYDLVLETIGSHPNISAFGAPSVLLPHPDGSLQGLQGASGVTNILKLHGSVDWVDAGGKIERRDAEAILKSDQVPLIGTPGPTKNVRHNGHFLPLWNEAEERLREADVVVFMGYRFPPSDSGARSSILSAIRENKQPHVRVHTVLGPKAGEDDTVRLLKLLELTLQGGGRQPRPKPGMSAGARTYDLLAQPLYCEDFLTVLNNLELLGPLASLD